MRNAKYLIPFLLVSLGAYAQDKSGSRSGLMKLPEAGGTVEAETGAFKISNNRGSSDYTLPLPNLPTRAGFAPSVALRYSQFNGDSGQGFGIGWTVSIPSITTSQELGIPLAGQLTTGEFRNYLTFEGQRLTFIERNGTDIYYRLRAGEEEIRFIYHSSRFNVSHAHGVDVATVSVGSGFEVIHPDGRHQLYSADNGVAEGRKGVVTRYPLVFEVAPTGETIAYGYQQQEGRSYLKSIVFAGGASRYDFEMMDGLGHLRGYALGFEQTNRRLYSRVVARFQDTVHAQWCLAYVGRDPETRKSMVVKAASQCLEQAKKDLGPTLSSDNLAVLDELKAVYRYGADPILLPTTKRLPNMQFSYSSWSKERLGGNDLVYPLENLGQSADFLPENYELADVNQDGLVDALRRNSNGTTTVFYSTGDLKQRFVDGANWSVRRDKEISPDLSKPDWHFADFNGDSYVDLVQFEEGQNSLYLGQADGSFLWTRINEKLTTDNSLTAAAFKDGKSQFIDINGDGMSDVLTTALDPSNRVQWKIYLNTSAKIGDRWDIRFRPKTFRFPFADDIRLSNPNFRLLDMNGDRLPDIVFLKPSIEENKSGLCVYLNQGRLYELSEKDLLFGSAADQDTRCGEGGRFLALSGLQGVDHLLGLWLVDVNGDGVTDVATMGNSRTSLYVWLGFGDMTLAAKPLILPLNLPVKISDRIDASRSRVVDMDGDGQLEILIFDKSADANQRAMMIDFNRLSDRQLVKSNLLTTIAMESGQRFDIRYATSTSERIRDLKLNRPVTNLHFPVVLAKQVLSSYGIPSMARKSVQVQEFFYHRPSFDPDDKEFLGFSEVEILNYGDNYSAESSLTRESYYTFAKEPAARRLAGKLKNRSVYRVVDDFYFRDQAAKSNTFDPNDPATHSWLHESEKQGLPVAGNLLSRETAAWEHVERGLDTYFLRKTEESKQIFDEKLGEQTPHPYRRAVVYDNFDSYNYPHTIKENVDALEGPFQVTMPAVERITSYEYDNSRIQLAAFGTLNAPDSVEVQQGFLTLSSEAFVYNDLGLIAEHRERVTSRLQNEIPGLEGQRLTDYDKVHTYGYDTYGNRTSVKDGLGLQETLVYDTELGIFPERRIVPKANPAADDLVWILGHQNGRLKTVRNPLGLEIAINYDTLGRRSSYVGADGSEQRYDYRMGIDGRASMILTQQRRYADSIRPDTGETTWIHRLAAYLPNGQMIATVEDASRGPRGAEQGIRVREYAAYDRNQRRIFVWTPYDFYEGSPSVKKIFDKAEMDLPMPKDQIGTRIKYDYLGRTQEENWPSGLIVRYSYAPWGLVKEREFKRDNAIITQLNYLVSNDLGLYANILQDKASSEAHMTLFERDELGHLQSIRLPDAKDQQTLVYDNRGLIEWRAIAGLGTYYYAYDQRDRLTHTVRVSQGGKTQQSIVNAYDSQNRISAVIMDGNLSNSYEYDLYPSGWKPDPAYHTAVERPLGMLTQTKSFDKNFNHTERLAYDLQARPVQRSVILGEAIPFTESYRYLLDGSQKAVKNPMGMEGRYNVDAAGALRSVKMVLPGSSRVESIIEDVTYNPKGQLEDILYRWQDLGGDKASWARTHLSYETNTLLLKNIDSSFNDGKSEQPLQNLGLRLDQDGNILEITDGIQNSPFGLVNRHATFGYNWKGELTSSERFGRKLAYDYAPDGSFTRNEELGKGTISPHAEYSMLPQGTAAEAYAYDGFGQLIRSPKVRNALYNPRGQLTFVETEGFQSYFGYSAEGERVYKRVINRQTKEVQESFYPMESMSVEPGSRQSFIFAATKRLVRLEEKTGEWYYYLHDHLGSSDVMMHSSGTPVEQMLYQPYGSEESPEKLSTDWVKHKTATASKAPKEKTHNRFTGHYLDDDSGLYYAKARYYDPKLGRFIQPDPMYLADATLCEKNPIECNLYVYAGNNPQKYVDSTGKWMHLAIGAGVGALTAGAFEAYSTYKEKGEINWKKTGSAALGGGIAGLAVTANPFLAAGAGMAGNLVKQGINIGSGQQEKFDKTDLMISTVAGLAGGVVAGRITGGAKELLVEESKALTRESTKAAANATFHTSAAESYRTGMVQIPHMVEYELTEAVMQKTNSEALKSMSQSALNRAAAVGSTMESSLGGAFEYAANKARSAQ